MNEAKHITVIGGGTIAVELIEAFTKNNLNVTLIERSPYILSVFDEDISALVQDFILEHSDDLVKIINNAIFFIKQLKKEIMDIQQVLQALMKLKKNSNII